MKGRSFSHRIRSARGTALLEAALMLPLLLLVSVGIFEFGRAFQTWQVLTNAAREGARAASLPAATQSTVQQRVYNYMRDGALTNTALNQINVNMTAQVMVNGANVTAPQITIVYPFNFQFLNPVARLVNRSSGLGSSPLSITATAQMRSESGI